MKHCFRVLGTVSFIIHSQIRTLKAGKIMLFFHNEKDGLFPHIMALCKGKASFQNCELMYPCNRLKSPGF